MNWNRLLLLNDFPDIYICSNIVYFPIEFKIKKTTNTNEIEFELIQMKISTFAIIESIYLNW